MYEAINILVGGCCVLIEIFCVVSVTESIRCKCSTHNCPGDHINETCTTEGHCYKKVEQSEEDGLQYTTYGCLPPEEQTTMQCKTPDHIHSRLLSIECCSKDLCNDVLQPKLPTTAPPTTSKSFSLSFSLS